MIAPIARVEDMHLCPMATPAVVPVPHVGGPIKGPGAPTVLAGGQMVCVAGDIAICVGPPDIMCMGSPTVMAMGRPVVRISDSSAHGGMAMIGLPTVMVGDSGGRGSAQAGTMSAAKAGGSAFVKSECNTEAGKAVANAATVPAPTGTAWIEVEFVDEAGHPAPFQRVIVTDAGGTPRTAYSDKDGLIRVEGMKIGAARVTLPDLDGSSWAPATSATPRTTPAPAGKSGGAADADDDTEPRKLRLVLQTLAAKPVKNAACTVRLGQSGRKLTTDGSGKLEVELAPGVKAGELVLDGVGTALHGVTIPFKVGALSAESSVIGQEARLNNLGYRAGNSGNPSSVAFRSAVEEFQCDEKLAVDGVCGPVTQAKLRSVHGS